MPRSKKSASQPEKSVSQAKKSASQTKKSTSQAASKNRPESGSKLFTLVVFLTRRPVTRAFAKRTGIIARTIQIRGNQTLEDLHESIFDAFDRYDEHLYEFQFGKKPFDRQGPTYVMPDCFEGGVDDDPESTGLVNEATIASLPLKMGSSFWYWFDFGDDWWHQIHVVAIDAEIPKGKFPKVIHRVGESPPQYDNEDEDEDEEDDD